MRKWIAEFIGTFALVFAGTGAIVINDISHGAITHVGIALTFGLVVLAMVYTLGDISGAHLNPAVSIGFWIARRFPGSTVGLYVTSQVTGALTASLLLRLLFPSHSTLGATLPAGPQWQSFILELILIDVRDLECLHRREGKRNYRRHCRRFSDRSGSDVRRSDLWCLDESGAVSGASSCFRSSERSLALSDRSNGGSSAGRGRLSLRPGTGMLLGG